MLVAGVVVYALVEPQGRVVLAAAAAVLLARVVPGVQGRPILVAALVAVLEIVIRLPDKAALVS